MWLLAFSSHFRTAPLPAFDTDPGASCAVSRSSFEPVGGSSMVGMFRNSVESRDPVECSFDILPGERSVCVSWDG
jgi:hypothetical protein